MVSSLQHVSSNIKKITATFSTQEKKVSKSKVHYYIYIAFFLSVVFNLLFHGLEEITNHSRDVNLLAASDPDHSKFVHI